MRRVAIIGVFAALAASVASATGAPAASADRPLYETDPSPALSVFTEKGVRRCSEALGKTTEHLFRNEETKRQRTHGAWGTWHAERPDDRLLVANVATQFSDGSAVTTISASPTPGTSSSCDVTYTTAFVYRSACQVVREKSYRHLPFVDELNGDSLVLGKPDAALRVMLLPQGEGKDHCLAVMTETVYGMD